MEQFKKTTSNKTPKQPGNWIITIDGQRYKYSHWNKFSDRGPADMIAGSVVKALSPEAGFTMFAWNHTLILVQENGHITEVKHNVEANEAGLAE